MPSEAESPSTLISRLAQAHKQLTEAISTIKECRTALSQVEALRKQTEWRFIVGPSYDQSILELGMNEAGVKDSQILSVVQSYTVDRDWQANHPMCNAAVEEYRPAKARASKLTTADEPF